MWIKTVSSRDKHKNVENKGFETILYYERKKKNRADCPDHKRGGGCNIWARLSAAYFDFVFVGCVFLNGNWDKKEDERYEQYGANSKEYPQAGGF